MQNPIPKPTEAELEILQILWQKEQATVRDVHEQLTKSKESVYTTTLKIMQIMAEKGLVTRNEENRTHIYMAAVKEEDIQKTLLDKFIDTTFRGSAMKLVMQALGNNKTSSEELAEIQRLLEQMRGKKPF
ncbi:BlaI/MecI/CopY family transcriptional regulator [Cytophagaceae bacterium DM2B3-1]|uniref:BlaI/MecI/CopY family transcriptional regulator n=1 Tax=Xanthocytophaga flava TaxID=3048013 RepID=A0ABT7CNW2_9BACT|nr:BlaI/MecI/CopY family transcriptional regulator [Xanthocytophaga flavus]MDJ1466234.1 BlaI/MecI/CopY family transcriptional regulator [Xanthocytophaga flavus]MDJ1495439.1 BlaI/MecI/CopY family transcriptional regulator [Xanthocytophaga flavus]